MYKLRINYLHFNPVTASYVTKPCHWLYSSAIDYFTDKQGAACLSYFGWLLGAEISNKQDKGQSSAPV